MGPFFLIVTGLFVLLAALLFLMRRAKTSHAEQQKFFQERLALVTQQNLELEHNIAEAQNRSNTLQNQLQSRESEYLASKVNLEKYKQLVEDTDEFLFEVDYKGRFLYANPVMLNRLSYSEAELRNISYDELANPAQLSDIRQFYSRQYHQKQTDSYGEWEAINRFGESVWIGLRIRMSFDTMGRIINVKGIARDLSIQKSFERNRQKRLMSVDDLFGEYAQPVLLFKSMPDIPVSDAVLEWGNKEALRLINLSLFDIKGLTMHDVSEPMTRAVHIAISKTSEPALWSPKRLPQLVFRILAIRSESLIIILFADQSSQQLKQTQLEADNQFLRQIIDKLNIDVAVFSDQQEYRFINQLAVKDPAVRSWMIGKTDEEYLRFRNRPVDKALVRIGKFREVKKSRQAVDFEEYAFDSQKNLLHFRRSLIPILNQDQDVESVLVCGVNLTDKLDNDIVLKERLDAMLFKAGIQACLLPGETPEDFSWEGYETYVSQLKPGKNSDSEDFNFLAYPVGYEQITRKVQKIASRLDHVRINISFAGSAESYFFLPVGLISETIIYLNGLCSTADHIPISLSTDSLSGGNLLISFVADLRNVSLREQSDTGRKLSALLVLLFKTGHFISIKNGFLHLTFAAEDTKSQAMAQLARQVKLLDGKKINVGPPGQKLALWAAAELAQFGAEILPTVGDGSPVMPEADINVWLGTTLDFDAGLLNQFESSPDYKLLWFSTQWSAVESTNPNLIHLPIPVSGLELLEYVWKNAKQKSKRPDVKDLNGNIVAVNFDKVLEITDGDKEFMATLFSTYFNSLQECTTDFEEKLTAKDVAGLKFLLHKIRATINTFEIVSLDVILRETIVLIEGNQSISERKQKNLVGQVASICIEVENQIRRYAAENAVRI